jgi:hypothetical protein
MRNIVLFLILFISLPLFAKDAYKWTNADGVVIYSDTYQEGAERIRISGSKSSADSVVQDQTGAGYESFEIVQPENEATVRSNDGTVAIGLSLIPALAEGHAVKIVVDGTELKGDMKATQFTINNLNLGSHSIETRVVDEDGNVLISSNRITFNLRKASIITP